MPDYRVKYDSVYRDKGWFTLSKKFSAPDDDAALKKGRRIVRQLDKQSQEKSDGLEKCELVTVRKITRGRVSERSQQLFF